MWSGLGTALDRSDKRRQGRTWDVPSHQPLSQALDRHQQASSKPRGFSCRELAALVGATLPQGRFPCHLFCSSLPQSGLRNVSFSSSSIHSIAFFCLLDPALPCHRRRSLPLLAIVLFSAPKYHHQLLHLSGHHHPSSLDDAPHPTTALLFAIFPPQRHTHAVCYVVVLVNLSVSRSPTWAIRRPQSQQQGQHRCGPRSPIFCFEQRRERAQDPLLSPLSPLSRFLSNRAVHRHKKKRAKKSTVPG